MNSSLNNVSNFLRSKHIKIPPENEWLKECCDFYNVSNVTESADLQSFVYDQWLLADLRDINEQCLPINLQNIASTNVNGTFALQVDEVVNIGESYYSQLRKIRNAESDSISKHDDEEMLQAWQPKRGRTLKLSLTDGTQNLFAIEFEPVATLREPFIPGVKVLIHGPVECRRGVLFLTARNIRSLGGEADSLLIRNATENILSRKLNLSENPNPLNGVMSSITSQNPSVDSPSTNTIDGSPLGYECNTFLATRNNISGRIAQNHDTRNICGQLGQIKDPSSLSSASSSTTNNYSSRTDETSRCINSTTPFIDYMPCSNKKERTPLVGVVCPVISNKRSAESPPAKPDTLSKITKRHSNEINFDHMRLVLSSDTVVKTICELNESVTNRVYGTAVCVASVTKLISKPRIKNNNWRVTIEIHDDTADSQVTLSNSFLEDKIFGISAFEVLSQKDRMTKNPQVKNNIDQILRDGVEKILRVSGYFHLVISPYHELPIVNSIQEIVN